MKTKLYPVATTFGIKAPKEFVVTGFENEGNPYVPAIDPDYVFRKDLLRSFLAWYEHPDHDGFCFWGPTQSGKTSFVRQFAARLNIPVYEVGCKLRTEFQDWIGGWRLMKTPGESQPTMHYSYGPLPMALRNGGFFLVDEPDIMDPSELVGINPILDGGNLLIVENEAEIVKPHPWFRVVFGANTDLGGDKDGGYHGTLMQNDSVRERIRFVRVGYMDADSEIRLLKKKVPKFPVDLLKPMVEVANAIRSSFVSGKDAASQLSFTMSTRTLLRWVRLTVAFNTATRPLEFALGETLFGRNITQQEKDAVLTICKTKFGDLWDSVVSTDASKAGAKAAPAKTA